MDSIRVRFEDTLIADKIREEYSIVLMKGETKEEGIERAKQQFLSDNFNIEVKEVE